MLHQYNLISGLLFFSQMVLSEDKNNYNAMVFVGVASEGLDQYEQALKAYHMASEISPEQLLAWQVLKMNL